MSTQKYREQQEHHARIWSFELSPNCSLNAERTERGTLSRACFGYCVKLFLFSSALWRFKFEKVICERSLKDRGCSAGLRVSMSAVVAIVGRVCKRNIRSGDITSTVHVIFLCILLESDFNYPYLRLHDREV